MARPSNQSSARATYGLRANTASTSEAGSKVRSETTKIKQAETLSEIHAQNASKAVYQLIGGTESTIQLIKSAHVVGLRGYDENGSPIYDFMRYCSNQPSIWESEQSEPFIREQITIEGERIVNGNSRSGRLLQEFLDKHPSNGVIYRKLDPAKEAADSIQSEELILDMKLKIRELSATEEGRETLRVTGNALGYKTAAANKDINILKGALFELASTHAGAKKFMDSLNDRYSRALSLVDKAYAKGEISFKNNAVRWTNSDDELLVIPTGKDWKGHLAAHIASNPTSVLWQEFEKAAR